MPPRQPPPRSTASDFRRYPPRPASSPPEVVDPIWLLKAVAAVILAALVCGYASLCLLLYQGQWQLILHPRQTTTHPRNLDGAPLQFLRFGPDETGLPQRSAWFIPAATGARYAGLTILYLPAGDGSLLDAQPTLTLLHTLGINVFAVDYRGFGESPGPHPNQQRMTEDAEAAWQYLLQTQHTEPTLIPYGTGLGASLAVALAANHPAAPGLILDTPAPDPLTTVLADPRTRYLPVRWLLHDRFPLAEPLRTLTAPKLLLSSTAQSPAFTTAAAPKLTVELPTPRSDALLLQSLDRFLAELPHRLGSPAQ